MLKLLTYFVEYNFDKPY